MRNGLRVVALIACVAMPGLAAAQSAISGVVKDTSGAVLPGVTIEVNSDALIEKVRTAVTDDAGQYRVVALPVGIYSVTFSLTGFSTVRREGVVLTTNFTAPVNVELQLSGLNETLTVTGESPLVDVTSAVQQQQLTRAALDAIPTGRSTWALGQILPGIVPSTKDVGGSAGFDYIGMRVHGSKGDITYQVDGMSIRNPNGDGSPSQYWNDGMMEEFTYQTSAIPAEVASGGVRVMMTPREGSNQFKGYALGQSAPWTSDNYTDRLRAGGLSKPTRLLESWDTQFSLGGPIQRDRVWFFGSFRHWGNNLLIADSFYRDRQLCGISNPRELRYDCQGIDKNVSKSAVARFSWQATKRNKISGYFENRWKDRAAREIAAGISPEATQVNYEPASYTFQIKWVAPITQRLLWEAGVSNYFIDTVFDFRPEVDRAKDIARTDLLLLQTWGARPGGFQEGIRHRRYWSGSLSYVTGSHFFKTGLEFGTAANNIRNEQTAAHLVQEYRNGVPASVLVSNTPVISDQTINAELGIYLQDSWTFKRLTLNPGLRVDYWNSGYVAQSSPAGRFVPAREFGPSENIPTFTDISPRFSVAYQLFGTAAVLKASVGQYLAILGDGYVNAYNPMFLDTDRRVWTDRNGDDIAQDGEIGPPQKSNFGTRGPRKPDPDLQRRSDWEYTVSYEQQLLPGVSASLAYIRRRFVDLAKSDNLLVGPEDYTPVTIPDPRNGQAITVYNLNPLKSGLTDILDTVSKTNREYWDGIELTAKARFREGGMMYGGVTVGGASQNLCDVDDPNQLRFCERAEPWRPQVKLGGTYPLPWRFQASATFFSFPGDALGISYNVNRTIVPGLTQAQVVVPLDDPFRPGRTLDRLKQLDARLAKSLMIGRKRVVLQVDVFNALNTNTVQSEITTFGPSLGRFRAAQLPRTYQLGAQLYF